MVGNHYCHEIEIEIEIDPCSRRMVKVHLSSVSILMMSDNTFAAVVYVQKRCLYSYLEPSNQTDIILVENYLFTKLSRETNTKP